MRTFGFCLLTLGALLIITGWSLDASISSGFSRDVVNLHQLFVKLSLILIGGFCLPTGAIFAVSAQRVQTTDGTHIPGSLPNIDLSRQLSAQKSPPPSRHQFRHRGALVEKTESGVYLVDGKEFGSTDEAKAFLDHKYADRLP